jgi:hypothetical protein
MAATVVICEEALSAPGVEYGDDTALSHVNMGSTMSATITAASYPITAGTNSYEKWLAFKCKDISTSSKIGNFKIWASGVLATGATLYTSATPDWGGYTNPSPFTTPVATASGVVSTKIMPVAAPTQQNVGYNGSNSYTVGQPGYVGITATGLYSDYIVMQIKTSGDATAGTTVTMNFQYDEVT